MTEYIPLSEIVANPYRNMDKYPVDEAKIEALEKSMKNTGFWENVIGRRNNGKVELAYGHHRWVTLQRMNGEDPKTKMPINLTDISDENMLRIMADENMQEWGTNAKVVHETIRAVVDAYAADEIKLKKPEGTQYIRYAPLFCVKRDVLKSRTSKSFPYTAHTIADFLGRTWKQPDGRPKERIKQALESLQAEEEKLIDLSDCGGLGTSQVSAVVKEAKTIQNHYNVLGEASGDEEYAKKMKKKGKEEAKKAAKEATKKMQDESDKTGTAKSVGMRGVLKDMKKKRPKLPIEERLPSIQKFVWKLSGELGIILAKSDPRWIQINEVIKVKEHLDDDTKLTLDIALEDLINRCEELRVSMKTTYKNNERKRIAQ